MRGKNMGKYYITAELAGLIKTTREENNVSGNEISKKIGKSQAYFSKLENGQIKTIDDTLLIDIFKTILGNDEKFDFFINEKLINVLENLKLSLSQDELDAQIWFDNFDKIIRQLPIPEEFVDDINGRLLKLGIDSSALCQRINTNEDIDDQDSISSLPINIWTPVFRDGDFYGAYIRMSIEDDMMKAILSKQKQQCNYSVLFAIAYYLLKIENKVGPGSNEKLKNEAKYYLNSFKIASLVDKGKIDISVKSDGNRPVISSQYDEENTWYIKKITKNIKTVSEIDIVSANKKLDIFSNNTIWDAPFMLSLNAIDYKKMKLLSHEKKQEFLNDVKQLVEKYANEEDEYTIKLYD